MTYRFTQHDTWPPLKAVLADENGPVPLTGAAVTFKMSQVQGSKLVTGVLPSDHIFPATSTVMYPWRTNGADTDTPGIYQAQFFVVFGDGSKETFPAGEDDQYFDVVIDPAVGG